MILGCFAIIFVIKFSEKKLKYANYILKSLMVVIICIIIMSINVILNILIKNYAKQERFFK